MKIAEVSAERQENCTKTHHYLKMTNCKPFQCGRLCYTQFNKDEVWPECANKNICDCLEEKCPGDDG